MTSASATWGTALSTSRRRRILTDKQAKARLRLRQLKADVALNTTAASEVTAKSELSVEESLLLAWKKPWPGYRPLPAALVWPNLEIILAVVYVNGIVQVTCGK